MSGNFLNGIETYNVKKSYSVISKNHYQKKTMNTY